MATGIHSTWRDLGYKNKTDISAYALRFSSEADQIRLSLNLENPVIFETHDTKLSPEIILSHSPKADWQEGKEIISSSPLSIDLNILSSKHCANNLRLQLTAYLTSPSLCPHPTPPHPKLMPLSTTH